MEQVDLYQYEKELQKEGINLIAGVDEVGRGPLVGPVVVACVILPQDFVLEGLTDSKKLSEKKREKFYDYIMEHALSVSVSEKSEKVIDEVNIYEFEFRYFTINLYKIIIVFRILIKFFKILF